MTAYFNKDNEINKQSESNCDQNKETKEQYLNEVDIDVNNLDGIYDPPTSDEKKKIQLFDPNR